MITKVGRNDPCVCGSGKKYKKCCGKNETVAINALIEEEIVELQQQLVQYAGMNYQIEIEDDFDLELEFINLSTPEEENVFEFYHTIWFSLFEPLEEGGTILEEFIEVTSRRLKRPRLEMILKSWVDAKPVIGQVSERKDSMIILEDLIDGVEYEVALPPKYELENENDILLGFLLPFEARYTFFFIPLNYPGSKREIIQDFMYDDWKGSGYVSIEEYFTREFISVMYELQTVCSGLEPDLMEWSNPIFKEVAELLKEDIEKNGEASSNIDIGLILWFKYCEKNPNKRIKNPAIYAAALRYLLTTFLPMFEETQAELSGRFGVSAGSISSAYKELHKALEGEISLMLTDIYDDDEDEDFSFIKNGAPFQAEELFGDLQALINEQEFESEEEVEAFLQKYMNEPIPKREKISNQDKALDLIYEALNETGRKKYKLAEEALKLNPNCADAYNILVERATSLEETLDYYKKGMEAGAKELGLKFFKENRGHFWGMIETRPYMRSRRGYAETLYELGRIKEAINHFEELLEMNPNDNQGNRELLFIAYVAAGELKKAKALLQQYEEASASALYNKLLLEILEKGFSSQASMLLKHAKSLNRHIIDYLTGKKQFPKYPPESYGFGSKEEAVIYAYQHLHLWKKINGVNQWLTK